LSIAGPVCAGVRRDLWRHRYAVARTSQRHYAICRAELFGG